MDDKKTIVIVEDDAALNKALSQMLEEEGFAVASAVDGETGLRLIEEKRPDLVVLDIILPRKSGFEVLEEVRKKPELSMIPVVVLTNLEGKKDIERMMEFGVQGFLVKAEYTLEEITAKIKSMLAPLETSK